MGLSSFRPLDIKLPKRTYEMILSYPDYKILDTSLHLKDSMSVTLETSDELSNMLIIMVPEKDF